MSLLQSLGLEPKPAPPRPAPAAAPPPLAHAGNGMAQPAAVQGAEAVATARALRPLLDAREKKAREAYGQLVAGQPKLEAALAAAQGEQKKALEGRKAALDKHLGTLQAELKSIDADRKALADAGTDAATCNAILARMKAPVGTARTAEVDRHDSPVEKTIEKKRTTTTTSTYVDGKATTRTVDTKTGLDADGLGRTRTTTNEVVQGDNRTTGTVTQKTGLGADGFRHEKSAKIDREVDGQKSGAEKKTGVQVGLGGATRSDERKVTNADGSATATSRSQGVERADGRLGAKVVGSTTATDAAGNEVKKSVTGKGGLVAGKDGLGAYGEGERAFERKGKNGLTTGAVAGLNANVVCNVVARGTTPPTYDLSVSVNLGVSVSLSAKKEQAEGKPEKMRDKGSASVGGSASGSMAVVMTRHHVLDEAAARAYIESLKGASAGSGGGTEQELAIIRLGVSKGWDAARDAYLNAMGKAQDPAELAKLKAGESVETGMKKKAGGGVSVGAKGVGVDGGYEIGRDQSTKVTREDDGKLTYDTSQGDSQKLSGAAKVSVGAVEGGFSASHAMTTSTGYKISIDPKATNAPAMQKALAECRSQADLDAFARKFPEAVRERTVGTGSADTQGASIGAAGAKAAVSYGNSVDTSVTRDKDGKLVKKTVTGANQGGVEFSAGKLKVGDSAQEKAVAEIDGEGRADLDVGKTSTSTDAVKVFDAVTGRGVPQKKGALATAAGGTETNTDSSSVEKMRLKSADLKYLAWLACNDLPKWMNACNQAKSRDDWRNAAHAIKRAGGGEAAAAEHIAVFVGKDSVGRKDIVTLAVRKAGDVSSGSRSEFPEGLAKLEPEYNALVIADAERTLDAVAEKDGAKKAADAGAEMLAKLEQLYKSLGSATFRQPAVQAEMLGAINARKDKVRGKLRVLAGGKEDELSKAELMQRYNDLLRTCTDHKHIEKGCFDELVKLNNDVGQAIPIAKLIKQLRDLHALWTPKYDDLAALAQEHGFGKDIYWKYKPDTARFEKAVKGAPGEATPIQPETADKKKKSKQALEDDATANQGFRDMQDDSVKKMRAMAQQIPAARARVLALSKQLEDLAEKNYKAAADKLFGEAKALYLAAEREMKRCKPNHVPDMMSYGTVALEDYSKAIQLLSKGVALYPKAAAKPK